MDSTYWIALGITLVVEIPVVVAFFAGQRLRMGLVALVATSVTHLIMHFVLVHFVRDYDQMVLWGEVMALVLEAAAYALVSKPRDIPRALMASATANALSYSAGLVIFSSW